MLFSSKGGCEVLLSLLNAYSSDQNLWTTCYRVLQSSPGNGFCFHYKLQPKFLVVYWLESNHLQQYVKPFLANGYDDMLVISELTEEDIAKVFARSFFFQQFR